MKLSHAIATIAASTLTTPTWADAPGKNWISRERVGQILDHKGYRITKMEADDGHWEGEAVRRGVTYEFHVDPRSGRITKLERDRD